MYDVIIVGAGPAGLTAAIYTSRKALKTLIVSKGIGGQAAITDRVENYPGFKKIAGFDLAIQFKEQAESLGVEFLYEEVEKIERKDNYFIINDKIETKTIILAFGLTPRNLDVPGEKKLMGKGVSYCATCDGPFFKEKTVAVVGGGNSALEAAVYLSKITSKVYIIHRREEFRGDAILLKQVNEDKKINLILNSAIKEIKGKEKVESIVIEKIDTKEEQEIRIDGLFIEIGYLAKTDLVKNLVKLDEKNQVIIDHNNQTSEEGIFAAGDITTIHYKQIVISAGEGAKAGLSAYKYLQEKEGKKFINIDWSKK